MDTSNINHNSIAGAIGDSCALLLSTRAECNVAYRRNVGADADIGVVYHHILDTSKGAV